MAPDERDALQRFVFDRAGVRGELVRLDATWHEVVRRRELPPALRDALGELTAACALLSATIKFDGGLLTLQIQGGGPVTLLVVECRSDLRLRAAATWKGDISSLGPQASLRALAGDGRCAITIDPGPGLQAYQSTVPLEGLTTADVLEGYMTRSEQLETRFLLAADTHRAAGLLLQRLPTLGGRRPRDEDPELWTRASACLDGVSRSELLRQPGSILLRRFLETEDLRVFESLPLRFACRCSRARVGGVIRMIGAAEARSILTERGEITVTCEFCGESYVFSRDDTEDALRDQASGTPPAA